MADVAAIVPSIGCVTAAFIAGQRSPEAELRKPYWALRLTPFPLAIGLAFAPVGGSVFAKVLGLGWDRDVMAYAILLLLGPLVIWLSHRLGRLAPLGRATQT